jgi:hypothetical protein
MIGLDQPNSSCVIISSSNDVESVLYGKDYTLIPIKEYYNGEYNDYLISYSRISNDVLREDTLFLLNRFNKNFALIKYIGESSFRKIFKDGSESLLEFTLYNTDMTLASYIYNGYSFSFKEKIRYSFPSKKEDIKNGMILEYFNNNLWIKKLVSNVDTEYDKLYKLLIKYNKVRIPQTTQSTY